MPRAHAASARRTRWLVAALVLLPVISLYGLTETDEAEAARDPWLRPFASTSIWNMPIGSSAQYADAALPVAGAMGLDKIVLRRLSASDPSRPLIRPGTWRERCTGTITTGVSLPIPDGWIVPDATQRADGSWSTPNNVAALLLPDGRTLVNTNAVARCDQGGPIFGWQTGNAVIDRTDLYGDGRFGSHGASRLSGIGGAIRPGELSGDAPVRHALDLLVWAKHLHWGGDGFRWPAAAADSYASSSYVGSNPEVQMGSLLAIPPWMTASSLGVSTPVGLKLFAAMQDYGGYVTDDSAWDANYISVDQAAIGTFAWGASEQAEMKRIIDAAHVVVNNGPTSVGGGGTPRQPLLPELTAPGSATPQTTTTTTTTTTTVPTTTAPAPVPGRKPPKRPKSTTVVDPARVMDTRESGSSVDGRQIAEGEVIGGDTVAVQIGGRAGVPADATVAFLNVTITEAAEAGFATVFPCGVGTPETSTINFEAGRSVANAAVVGLDADGRACITTSSPADVIVDVGAWFAGQDGMRSTPPTRLVDTRSSPGERVPGAITRVRTTDRAGVPGTADVGMVALNVTVTEPQRAGFATVSPCGGTRARTSSLNFEAGATVANAVLVAPGSTGDVCVDVDAGAHVIVDLIGWVPATSDLQPVPPARLADTRTGSVTVDGWNAGTGALRAGGIVAVDVLGRAGVPVEGVAAVALNVTTTSSRRDGFLTVHPCGTVVPATSTLNHLAGRSVAGAAVVRLGDGDRVCVFSDAPGDVVVDVTGYVSR